MTTGYYWRPKHPSTRTGTTHPMVVQGRHKKGGVRRTIKRYSKGNSVAVERVMPRFGSDRKRRRRRANTLYEFEMALREEGLSVFVYDEGEDLFRFPDGKFAFSGECAAVKLLEERGYFG